MKKTKVLINNKQVDVSTIELDGIDFNDHPDYCDAYIDKAEFIDGIELTPEECETLTDEYKDLVNSLANNFRWEDSYEHIR
jgi:hypothetical protein